jgi:tellurite resistance protein
LIYTATAAQLADATPDEVLREIQSRVHRFNWFKAYCWMVGILGLAVLSVPVATMTVVLIGLVPGYFIYKWNRERRTARLIYDVDDEVLVQRFAMCNVVGEALAQTRCLWHIYSSVATRDSKRNAGANALIRRTRTRCTPGSLSGIELNIEPWCVTVGPQQLLFLPDRLLIHEGAQFAAIPYERLVSESASLRFIEEEGIPGDSRQVDTTWRFVNKSGGPDRRFNNNRQIPVLEYGRLTLSSESGMTVLLQCSNPACAARAHQALLQLQQVAQAAWENVGLSFAAGVTALPVEPAPPLLDPALNTSALPMVGVLLRYIAAADGKITQDEVELVTRILATLGPEEFASSFARQVRDLKSSYTDAENAARVLIEERPDIASQLVGIATQLANADGRVTPKEKERIAHLAGWLHP